MELVSYVPPTILIVDFMSLQSFMKTIRLVDLFKRLIGVYE